MGYIYEPNLILKMLIFFFVLIQFNLIGSNDLTSVDIKSNSDHDSVKSHSPNQGHFLSKSVNDVNLYRIIWLKEDSSSLEKDVAQNLPLNDTEDNSVLITTSNREKYRCVLPNTLPKVTNKTPNVDSSFLNPFELLLPLLANPFCSYRLEQYWTYELCHGKYFRQYHEETATSKPVSQEYFLGKYDLSGPNFGLYEKKIQTWFREKSKPKKIQIDGVNMPYIEINMTGGTLCDLNSKPRFTRVLYICNEDSKNELYSIKETYTCEYEAIVFTPFLCVHSDFKVDSVSDLDINCFAIGNSPLKPKGFTEFEIDNRSKSPENLFDVKTIIIDASDISKKNIDLKNFLSPYNELPKTDKKKYLTSSSSVDPKLLKNFLSGQHCLHGGGTGWWKYEFCYGIKVEQYHEEKEAKKSVILGRWNLEDHKNWISLHYNKQPKLNKTPKYVSHYYGNGDICDVTERPRQVEVKLKCRYTEGDPESVVLYLLEPNPCDYILGIESPLICHLLSNIDEFGIMIYPDN